MNNHIPFGSLVGDNSQTNILFYPMVANRARCVLWATLRKSPEIQLSLLNNRSLLYCDFAYDLRAISFPNERHSMLLYAC
jgi:hypothetical protein